MQHERLDPTAAPPIGFLGFGGLDLEQMMSMLQDPQIMDVTQRMMAGQPVDFGTLMTNPTVQAMRGQVGGPQGGGFGGQMGGFGAPQGPAAPQVPELVKAGLLARLLGRDPTAADAAQVARPQVRPQVFQLLQALQTSRANGLMLFDDVVNIDLLLTQSLAAFNSSQPAAPAFNPFAHLAPAPQPQAAGAAAGAAAAPQYEAQLAELNELGFTDRAKCLQALQASGGRIEAAVDWLLEH
jgi:hypothetical protein